MLNATADTDAAQTETARTGALARDAAAERADTRISAPYLLLRRKISSRLARHVPLKRWRLQNPGPMVSFTFDDAPESALCIGAAMLEAWRCRGTYYIATGLVGRKTADYQVMTREGVGELHRRGHEIGLHGHAHREAGRLTARGFVDDLAFNRAQLEAIDAGIRPLNFAYPFGMADFSRKRQLSGLVRSSRGVCPGVNSGEIDPHFLKCVELTNARLTVERLKVLLDAVVSSNGWLIFLSHDVSPWPSPYGCTPELLTRALAGAAARRIEIVTVAGALSRGQGISAPLAGAGRPGDHGNGMETFAMRRWPALPRI